MEPHPDPAGRWRRVLRYLQTHERALVAIFVLTLLTGVAGALEPLVLKLVFDELAGGKVLGTIVAGVGALLGLELLREAVMAVNNWLTWKTRIGVQYELLAATVGKLHSLPLSFHQAGSVGATMTKLDRGVQGVAAGLSELAFNVLPALVYLCLALAIMLRLDWRATLVVLAFVPLPMLIGTLAAPRQARRERLLLERWTRIYGRFNEVLSGILTVKTFVMEETEKQRFLRGVDRANREVVRGVRYDSLVGMGKSTAVVLARTAALSAGVYLVLDGSMSVGTVVAFLGYIAGMFGPVQGLVNVYQVVKKTSVSLDAVLSILDAQDTLGDAPDALEVTEVRGEVELDRVSFSYDGQRAVLEDVDLKIAAGEVVAVVGPSGSGKTTMMALLQRIYDPTSGVIRIDGKDLRALKQRSLRRHIGVVLQDSLVFNDTVGHNIAYGKPRASAEEIVAAARAAHAHDFILRLPQGYDTMVGERGGRLSAGQKQRLVIARAILKDSPILVLDEATSALDADSEAIVQAALENLVRGRTVFMIAHRLNTITRANRVIVLSQGRVVEQGTHEELLESRGVYAGLVHKQLQGLFGGQPPVHA